MNTIEDLINFLLAYEKDFDCKDKFKIIIKKLNRFKDHTPYVDTTYMQDIVLDLCEITITQDVAVEILTDIFLNESVKDPYELSKECLKEYIEKHTGNIILQPVENLNERL